MKSIGLREITTLECLAREFQVKNISLPVISRTKKVDMYFVVVANMYLCGLKTTESNLLYIVMLHYNYINYIVMF